MSKQRMVNTRFWDDNYTSNLDPIEKLLFLYFITNTSTNICGVYEIPLKKVAVETGIDKEMVLKIIERFTKDSKIFYVDGWIGIKNFVKHQNQGSPKVRQGIKIEIMAIPKDILDKMIRYGYGMDTLSYSNSNSNSNSNPNLTNTTSAIADTSFEEFWKQYPKKELKKKSKEIWESKKLSSKLVVILEFIKLASATNRWQKGFIKQPPAFLNGECWNDDLKSYGDLKSEQGLKITKY